MEIFPELFRHNAWANHVVLAAFRERPELLQQTDYDGDPLLERAKHLAAVERGFLDVLRGGGKRPEVPEDLEGLIAYCDETAAGWTGVASMDAAALDREHYIPWWERNFTAGEALAQVLSHSAQHRSELAWELARASIDTGELDAIVWAVGGKPGPGEELRFPEGVS